MRLPVAPLTAELRTSRLMGNQHFHAHANEPSGARLSELSGMAGGASTARGRQEQANARWGGGAGLKEAPMRAPPNGDDVSDHAPRCAEGHCAAVDLRGQARATCKAMGPAPSATDTPMRHNTGQEEDRDPGSCPE